MAEKIGRVPVREQDPKVRAHNFEEVCYGYNEAEALLESSRCLNCRNPRCVQHCPVGISIPEFIAQVKAGDFAAAAGVIARDQSATKRSSLPMATGSPFTPRMQLPSHCVSCGQTRPQTAGNEDVSLMI